MKNEIEELIMSGLFLTPDNEAGKVKVHREENFENMIEVTWNGEFDVRFSY